MSVSEEVAFVLVDEVVVVLVDGDDVVVVLSLLEGGENVVVSVSPSIWLSGDAGKMLSEKSLLTVLFDVGSLGLDCDGL